MFEVIASSIYDKWFDELDSFVAARVNARISRISIGNFGDCKPVGGGIFELRMFFGSGYRIYYMIIDGKLVILLCAGDKSSKSAQSKDINFAKEIAREYEHEYKDKF